MRALWDGIQKAKVRTTLNVLVIFFAAAAFCILLFNFNTFNNRETANFQSGIPQNSFQDNADTEDTDFSFAENENSNNESDSMGEDENAGQFENGRDNMSGRNANMPVVIGCVVIFVITLILLFIINFISTKKKDALFSDMMSHGVNYKSIRKELFKEAFIVVLIFGIIGTVVGTFISRPLASAVMPDSSISMDQSQRPSGGEGDFVPNEEFEGGDSERPDRNEDGDFNADIPDFNDNDMQDIPQRGEGNENIQNFETGTQSGTGSLQYIVDIACGVVFTIIASCIAGISCFAPVKKKNQ